MKTWSVMYGLIWAAFFQIFLVVFLLGVVPSSGFWYNATIGLHVVIGIIVIGLAGLSYSLVNKTGCPARIKRISRTTMFFGGAQGVLGLILYALIQMSISKTAQDVILVLHVSIALAIITQASSSATAYDMWEEKEFVTASPPMSSP